MNGLFRIAYRSLCWGLVVAIGLAAVVMAKGIHPDVLVTFKESPAASKPDPHRDGILNPPELRPLPPEFLARAETSSRLDVPNSGLDVTRPPLSRDVARLSKSRNPGQRVTALQSTTLSLPPHPDAMSTAEVDHGPMLTSPDKSSLPHDGSESRVPKPDSISAPAPQPGLDQEDPDPNSVTPVAPTDEDAATQESPVGALEFQTSSARNGGATSPPRDTVDPRKRPIRNSRESLDNVPSAGVITAPNPALETSFLERLTQMQRQLDQLALAQQQDRQAARSQFEMTQMFQQRKLEEKLENIEQSLRELRSIRSDSVQPPPLPAALKPHQTTSNLTESQPRPAAPTAQPLVQEEQTGPDGQKRYSVNSQGGDLRELLAALAQKANFNLVLAINVEGDVELSMQSVTADEALDAIKKTTGYVVEKSGQKVYIGPSDTKTYQRQEFLPPILK